MGVAQLCACGRSPIQRAEPIRQPVLHIHGRQDPTVLPATTTGSGDFVDGPYQLEPLDDCGHFPHEERPDLVLPMVLDWLAAYR